MESLGANCLVAFIQSGTAKLDLFPVEEAGQKKERFMMKKSKKQTIAAEDFDLLFEKGDVTPYLDKKSVKVARMIHRINLDLPENLLHQIDDEANRIGVARTALIKVWLAERLGLVAAASISKSLKTQKI